MWSRWRRQPRKKNTAIDRDKYKIIHFSPAAHGNQRWRRRGLSSRMSGRDGRSTTSSVDQWSSGQSKLVPRRDKKVQFESLDIDHHVSGVCVCLPGLMSPCPVYPCPVSVSRFMATRLGQRSSRTQQPQQQQQQPSIVERCVWGTAFESG